jgi:hypothetical protein
MNNWTFKHCWGNIKCYNHCRKQFGWFVLIKLSIYLIQNPVTLWLGVYPREMAVFNFQIIQCGLLVWFKWQSASLPSTKALSSNPSTNKTKCSLLIFFFIFRSFMSYLISTSHLEVFNFTFSLEITFADLRGIRIHFSLWIVDWPFTRMPIFIFYCYIVLSLS